jgi:hypothetical protein
MQMKANNGIFLIDDFGRQVMSPRELLNRWIVPLDRRVDYLTLSYGIKFQIPFEMMVVFSTNLNPDDLADATFLRRIQNKVFVEPVDVATFNEIWRRVAIQKNCRTIPRSWTMCVASCSPTAVRSCAPAIPWTSVTSLSRSATTKTPAADDQSRPAARRQSVLHAVLPEEHHRP